MALGVADGVADGRRVGVAVPVGLAVGVAVALGRLVGVAVAVGLVVAVALPVDVGLALDVGVSLGLPVAELLPVPPDEGDGVRTVPPEAVLLVVTCGLGVKTDGAVEEGDPPPLQAAIVTASRTAPAAPAAARPARPARPALRNAVGLAAGRIRADWVCPGRIGAGQLATGTVRRTFMKPPRMTGGQWRRSTHLSMCHPNRQGKSERADNSPPFRPTGIIPGADGREVRIDSHI